LQNNELTGCCQEIIFEGSDIDTTIIKEIRGGNVIWDTGVLSNSQWIETFTKSGDTLNVEI